MHRVSAQVAADPGKYLIKLYTAKYIKRRQYWTLFLNGENITLSPNLKFLKRTIFYPSSNAESPRGPDIFFGEKRFNVPNSVDKSGQTGFIANPQAAENKGIMDFSIFSGRGPE